MGRDTIRAYLWITFIYRLGLSFIAATYATFLLSKGLNLFEVNMVNVVFMTTMFLAEVPTGAIADVFGRRTSLFFACLLEGIAMFVYANATTFWGFAAAESLAAIGATCSTGAFQAWFVDRLKYQGYSEEELKQKVLPRSFGRAEQITHGTGITGGMIGAWIAHYYTAGPWLAGGVVLLVGCIIVLFLMKEEYFTPQRYSVTEGFRQMWQTMRTGMTYAVNHKSVRFIMILGLLQAAAVMAPNMQWQPFFLPHVGSKAALGWVWGGMGIFLLIGAGLTHRMMVSVKNEKWALVGTQVAIAVGIAATAGFSHVFPIAITAFLLHEVARGMWRPLKDVYLNDHIPSEQRATIGSSGAILHHFGAAVGLIVSGLLAEKSSIPMTWIVMSAILAIGTLLVAKNGKRE